MRVDLVDQSASETSNVLTLNQGSVDICEETVINAARLGCPAAFQWLVGCYETRIFRIAQRLAHSREDAEDIKQNAFVQAFKNIARFRGDSRFFTWLGRITINEGLMKIRSRCVKEISLEGAIETEDSALRREFEDHRPNPEQSCSQAELQAILAKMIARLSPAYRSVFQLRDVQGFSTCETAAALGITPTAVKSRLQRARLQIRKLLKQHFEPAIGDKSSPWSNRSQAASFFPRPSLSRASMGKP
jgi:RNA polymerase sigma-70 factor, ECF subfamily